MINTRKYAFLALGSSLLLSSGAFAQGPSSVKMYLVSSQGVSLPPIGPELPGPPPIHPPGGTGGTIVTAPTGPRPIQPPGGTGGTIVSAPTGPLPIQPPGGTGGTIVSAPTGPRPIQPPGGLGGILVGPTRIHPPGGTGGTLVGPPSTGQLPLVQIPEAASQPAAQDDNAQ